MPVTVMLFCLKGIRNCVKKFHVIEQKKISFCELSKVSILEGERGGVLKNLNKDQFYLMYKLYGH